ncbi:MAG: small, acid-soluble spore protein, alpha/beta type [Anaerostipes sp.]|jgi:small acid-soluble spore protein F (minor alpha/beta-type SASP)|nr:small, acid-soluble spore protein, alpha/beta type [Anaerostipes sp.]MDD3745514.1 small, acid-soluble spore protein, alpha/beta type [Anaerostipes sp.]
MEKKKKFSEKTFEEMTEDERLKYEVAVEIGLMDRVREEGWGALSSSETGRIGGLIARKKKENQK